MLMIESDMPGAAAIDELERGGGRLPGGRSDRRRPRRRRPGGRLAAPGAARRPLRARAARRRPDGGRRRAALAGPGHAPRDRARSRRSTTSGSGRSGTPATATSTPTSSSSAATRRPRRRPRRSRRTSTRRRSTSAARSPASTASGIARREWLEIQKGADAVRVMRADQGRPRSARHPQSRARHLGPVASRPPRSSVAAAARIQAMNVSDAPSRPCPSRSSCSPPGVRRGQPTSPPPSPPIAPSAERRPRAVPPDRAARAAPSAATSPTVAEIARLEAADRRRPGRRRRAARPRVRAPPAGPRDRRSVASTHRPPRPSRRPGRWRPDDALVLVGIGGLQLGEHEFAEALETGRQAVELSPNLAAARAVVVDALVELGRYDEADEAAEEMLAIRADLIDAGARLVPRGTARQARRRA